MGSWAGRRTALAFDPIVWVLRGARCAPPIVVHICRDREGAAAVGTEREAWGAELGVGMLPRRPVSELGFQKSLERSAGGGSVPSVCGLGLGRLVSVYGSASGETDCVYVRKKRPCFGAITAAC